MDEIILNAYGKINLYLDVLYKRDDGYHEINTIMQQIDLKDRIKLRTINKGIKIESTDNSLPLDNNNLVYKAWDKIIEKTGIDKGIHIFIEKNIPIAAGLAGGSSNGAAVLKGLNLLWDLKLSEQELMEMGKEIGADIPFCIKGGTAKAQGIGEKLTPLKSFSNKIILLANADIQVSTPHVYSKLNLNSRNKKIDIDNMVNYIEGDNLLKVAENMNNIMEEVVIKEHPIIEDLKQDMIEGGALGSIMTGSGPTVFGIFDDVEKLFKCKEKLEKKIEKVFVTKTI